ncbi:DUF7261 family protein [Haloarcula amylovorans]|uniref:DUF7261 family protein n=1 Tax=Haloarcula amylovorans TaxID=2562280 RepID=UPI0010760A01|nr:hypothetical protein [Halomicroarcula amylolytica]
MADLRRRERGQILLVAALALAVIFVALALIVNSAIFSENLASRGETAGSDDALEMRGMVETNVGDAVRIANRRNYSSPSELNGAVEDAVANTSGQTEYQEVRRGRLVNVTVQSTTEGVRIVQNDSSSFADDSGATNYEVVGGVKRVTDDNGTRAFRIDATSIDAGSGTPFEVKVNETAVTGNGNANSWRMQIWTTAAGGDTVHVRTLRNVSGSTTQEACEVTVDSDSPTYRIDVTRGTIDDEPCDALGTASGGENFHFGSGTGVGTSDEYDVYFRNASQIQGNFSMVVHDDGGLDLPLVGGLPGSDQPYETDALYDVTVRYEYSTANMRYETDIRVAPGEPDV